MNIHPGKDKDNDRKSNWDGCIAARAGSRRALRAFSFLFACCLFLNASPQAYSMNPETVEYSLKLAFLYNFTKFVEWPPDSYHSPSAPLVICIVGDDPFGPRLEGALRTRTAGNHPIEVTTLKPSDILNICHMVFVPATAEDQATRIVRGLKGSSTLTVGEAEGFAVLGGIINLTPEGNKLRFEVNLLAAERAGLKISANMLALAKIVHDGEHPTGD
jgi:hypothetical protein